MNSEMLYQMPGLSNNANQSKSSNIKANSRSDDSGSFKREMDKAYGRSENPEPTDRKDLSKPSDTKDNTLKDKPIEKDKIEVEQEPKLDEGDKEIISEILVLEATVAQLALLNRNDDENLGKALAEAVGLVTSTGDDNSLDGDGTSIFDKLSKAELTDDGAILLPELKDNEDVLVKMKKVLMENDGKSQITGMDSSLVKESELESKPESKLEPKAQETQPEAGKVSKPSELEGIQTKSVSTETEGDSSQQENIGGKTTLLDATKVNVKVGEAPVDTLKANIPDQLADKILYKLSQGKQEFELELNPRNLGKISIKMTFENGNAELVMSTSSSKAHQLLATQTEALRAILEGRTGMDANINVKQAETNDNQFDRDNFQDQSREQQNQKQQKEERRANENISFMERLRLGLTDSFEEAG